MLPPPHFDIEIDAKLICLVERFQIVVAFVMDVSRRVICAAEQAEKISGQYGETPPRSELLMRHMHEAHSTGHAFSVGQRPAP